MRSITVVLLATLACFAAGSYMSKNIKYADKDFLMRQTFVFEIFQHIHQDDVFSHKYETERNYVIANHYDKYDKVDLVKNFVEYWSYHPLHDDEIFTIMYEHHYKLAEHLVDALYLAKDFETFKSTALWARFNVNKQLFVYAFSIVCVHHPLNQGIVLPAVYEIYPYYFFGAETIQKAQNYKMHGFHNVKQVENMYQVVIPSNYTGKFGHVNDDNLLAYFTEDIGLNSFYYYFNLDYPFWTQGSTEHPLSNDYRGAMYLFIHWQLLARYYMERLSHGLGEIEYLNYYETFDAGYHTGLRYYNGIYFPNRDNHFNFYYPDNYEIIDEVTMWEHRLGDFVDTDYLFLENHKKYEFPSEDKYYMEHVDALGNLLQGNKDSLNERFFGHYDGYLRDIINHGIPYGKFEDNLPGPIMHFETSLRDPAFYAMYKRLLNFYWRYMESVPKYEESDLDFEGVKIENVEVTKLTTYYDTFDADITNVVDVEIYDDKHSTDFQKFGRVAHHDGHDFVIKARQWRLNHMPFDVKLTVNSDKKQKVAVKFFIAPIFDSHGHKIYLEDNHMNFFELDHFVYDLESGKNVIDRNSNDFSWYVKDRTTYFELYQKLMMASNSDDVKFPLDMTEAHCGIPQRLMLPRGKKGGMPFQFYFIVYPYHAPKTAQFTGFDPTISCGIGSGARYIDATPFGFPFDRPVDHHHFHYDNMVFYDTFIYHKTESDINAVRH